MAQKYEIYGGNFILPHPYAVEKMSGYGVAVTGKMDKLQALVNRTLNCNGNHPRYFVVAPTVLFTFMRMGCLRSTDAPGSNRGFFTERELNVTLLLAAVDMSGIRLVWYMPYLWLDSGAALIAGRDIYGFPKQLAEVTIPDGPGDEAKMTVKGEVLHRFDPVVAEDLDIVSVRRTDATQLDIATSASSASDALAKFLASVLQIDASSLPAGAFLPPIELANLRMAWMRQLPSIADFNQACFRSAVEAPFAVTTFRDAGLLSGNYELEIPQHDSVNIAAELGLGDGVGDLRMAATAAYHLSFDFQFAPGQELWVET